MSLGSENPDYEENCEKEQKGKKKESEKEEKHAVLLKVTY